MDHSCSYYKEVDPPYECIMAESSPHYAYCVCLNWDYDVKKFSNIKFEKIQQIRAYLNNKLLFTEILIDFTIINI